MKSDEGRVAVAGWYDRTKLTDADRALLAAVPDDESPMCRRLGAAEAEKVGATYQEALQFPSLNVRRLSSAATGARVANVLPHLAVAELDLRTTPEADAEVLVALPRKHVEKQGWHLVEGEPTDEERARHPKLARLTAGRGENADDKQHSFDENLRMGRFVGGMRTTLGLLLADDRE